MILFLLVLILFAQSYSIRDAKSCLKCVLNHLSPKGKFLLSIFIPNTEFLDRDENKLYPATDFFQFENTKCRILETSRYDSRIHRSIS